MEWKVYISDFNAKKIIVWNVFHHYSFKEDIKDIYKKYKNDFETFSKEVQTSLMYYYWAKCEWEVIVSDWPTSGKVEAKIDVYNQVMLNWDKFIKYTWDMCHARKNAKKVGVDYNG